MAGLLRYVDIKYHITIDELADANEALDIKLETEEYYIKKQERMLKSGIKS